MLDVGSARLQLDDSIARTSAVIARNDFKSHSTTKSAAIS
jgi:hypothetical protein